MSKDKKKTAPEAAEETKTEQPEGKAEAEQTAASGQETPETEEKQPENKEEAKEEQKPEEKAPAEEKKSGDYAALNDRYLRLCAEYDNFRKRSQKEKDALYGDVRANTLREFLPVYDNLVRALAQPTEDEAYKKGVEMIMAQFKATMEKLGERGHACGRPGEGGQRDRRGLPAGLCHGREDRPPRDGQGRKLNGSLPVLYR